MDNDELLDLVDSNDRVVGTIMRSKTGNLKNKSFLRAADAFILNNDGKLWIPRRQLNKRIAPGGLDYSMGEHVKSDEDYLTACIRGFEEELNIKVTEVNLEFVHKFRPIKNLDYFRSLYIYRSEKVPYYNTADFSEYFWLTPQELLSKLNGGEFAKRSLLQTVEYFVNS